MTFSVSIPVRGQPEFLPTALRSMAVQTVPVELALLDASPDDAVQRLVERHEGAIAYRYHRPDAGQAAAVQEGWDHTTGGIVAWLNADDYYFPDALAGVAAIFHVNPEVDVVYGHGVHVSAEGDFQTYFPAIDPDIERIADGCVICQPACFVRRRAMERVGGLNPALHYAMDWDFWLRLYRANCVFRFLDAPLAAVRVYPETKTLSGAGRRYREIDRLLRGIGVPWRRRVATLMGFRLYDLRHRRRGPAERLACAVLLGLARLRRAFMGGGRRRVNGLECWTNRVEGGCLVELPWYEPAPPREVRVVVDRPARLSLSVNGREEAIEECGIEPTAFLGASIAGRAYRARLARVTGNRLSCRLDSRSGAWRLLSLAARG